LHLLLILAATKTTSSTSSSNASSSLEFLLIIGVIFIGYFMWRRGKFSGTQQIYVNKDLVSGDEIVTKSGIIGIVDHVTDDRVWLEISPGVVIEVLATSIDKKIPQAEVEEPKPIEKDEGHDES
jgi:preprotein translocase YajC subunit